MTYMEERGHVIEVLEQVKSAIESEDTLKLNELSNQTIHSASIQQDIGSITTAVIVYSLSKLIDRKQTLKIKNWNQLMKKITSQFSLAIRALKENKEAKYQNYMQMTRRTISSTALNIKPYIQEVLRKASINKASKIYAHGISLGRTAEILGVSEWELSEYTGQTKIPDVKYNISLDVKKRAALALEFFS